MKYISYLVLLSLIFFYSCKPKTQPTYDALVYGATPAGITTAISLAKKGKSVILICQQKNVGGMYAGGLMTSELMHMKKQCISGLANDFYIRLSYNTPEGYYHKFKPGKPAHFFECKGAEKTFLEWLAEYKDYITVKYDVEIEKVIKKGNTITSTLFTDGSSFNAKYFVDCSYEGDLMYRAGVSYDVGREAKDVYGEDYAGIRFQPDTLYGTTVDENGERLPFFNEIDGLAEGDADNCVAAYNYRCVLTKIDSNKLEFIRPDDYDSTLYYAINDYLQRNPDSKLGDFFGIIKRGNGKTGFNTSQSGAASISVGLAGLHCNYPLASYEERDSIRSFYEKYTKGLFYYLSSDKRVPEKVRSEMAQYGYAKDEFVDNNNFPYYFYIREGIRLQGDSVFTENDLLRNRTKEDAIILGSHWIDCHSIQKLALSDTTYIKEGNIWVNMEEPYEIPYSIMLPKENEAANLLVPVAVSTSHVAFCSVRLESTWMQLGHAAGNAISQVLDNGESLHSLNVKNLQKSLKNEGMLVKLQEYYDIAGK